MKIRKVFPMTPGFVATCIDCGRRLTSTSGDLYADLEGEPFEDYYCQRCAAAKED